MNSKDKSFAKSLHAVRLQSNGAYSCQRCPHSGTLKNILRHVVRQQVAVTAEA